MGWKGGWESRSSLSARGCRTVRQRRFTSCFRIALACCSAPPGHERWTLRLLAGKVVELGLASSISHEGVRKRLKKTLSSRGRRRSGAFPR